MPVTSDILLNYYDFLWIYIWGRFMHSSYTIPGLCRPRCDKWEDFSKVVVTVIDVMTIISALIGLFSGTAVLMLSCIRWKRM